MTTLNKRAVAQVLAGKPDDYVRQLLELRRTGARAAVNKFKRMLAYASPADDRMRGTLRMYRRRSRTLGWLGPQLQNLKKNESGLPLSVVDSIRAGDRSGIAQYGNPLSLLGDVSRAALCASPGLELKSGDFSAVESVVLAWLAGEHWKLVAYETFQRTGDKTLEPYRVIARKMLQKPADAEITDAERQLGKGGELASGFGGSVGAWRRIVPHDPRSDDEIKAIIQQWRGCTSGHVQVLERARAGHPGRHPHRPADPGRATATAADRRRLCRRQSHPDAAERPRITYPEARLVPGKFEDGPSDVQFMDNARGQWKPYRGWFGTFVENVVQGTARDLLAAAIERFESRGIPVVFHCHDEVTVEVPIGSLSDAEFLEILLKLPPWAAGLPLGGKVHSGSHYLEAPEQPAEPLVTPDPDDVVLENAVDVYIDDTRDDIGEIDDPALVEREDDEDFVANLADTVAPLTELVTLPLTPDNKVACPFHDDVEPSCTIYPDHFHCFGCGEHGSRLDWLMRVEGMTEGRGRHLHQGLAGPAHRSAAERRRRGREARLHQIDLDRRPSRCSARSPSATSTRPAISTSASCREDIHRSLRFHPHCVFGPGTHLPCLIALMRDPLTDEPVGIQRIALEHRDGKIEKIERRMLGRAGVVKLWPAGSTLVVGEGSGDRARRGDPDSHSRRTVDAGLGRALESKARRPCQSSPASSASSCWSTTMPTAKARPQPHYVATGWRTAGRTVVPLMPPVAAHRLQRSGSAGGQPCRSGVNRRTFVQRTENIS